MLVGKPQRLPLDGYVALGREGRMGHAAGSRQEIEQAIRPVGAVVAIDQHMIHAHGQKMRDPFGRKGPSSRIQVTARICVMGCPFLPSFYGGRIERPDEMSILSALALSPRALI